MEAYLSKTTIKIDSDRSLSLGKQRWHPYITIVGVYLGLLLIRWDIFDQVGYFAVRGGQIVTSSISYSF